MEKKKKIIVGAIVTGTILTVGAGITMISKEVKSQGIQPNVQTALQNSVVVANELTTEAETSYIGEVKAKQIALEHANLNQTDVEYLLAKFDYDNGIAEYEIEFLVGNKEYDYTINAITGEILEYDYEVETQVTSGTTTTQNATTTNQTATTSYIGETKAKQIALEHANLNETDVEYLLAKLDYDNGIAEYEIEFLVGNKEYDYTINAITGTILEYDYDVETQKTSGSTTSQNTTTTNQTATTSYIGETKAKQIALDHAGVSGSNVEYLVAKLDYDDGIAEYEIEFLVGNKEYDYTINAITGTILEYDYDVETQKTSGTTTQNTTTQTTNYIGETKAKQIALNDANVQDTGDFYIKCELDYDGIYEYEIEWQIGKTEYEYTINATTGAIIERDIDID